jgi:hypothetical protein
MSIFGHILNKIFHHTTAQASTGSATSQSPSQPSPNTAAGESTSRQPTGATAQPSNTANAGGQPSLKNVDVQAVLSQLASQKGGSNWRTSVVDLLKLLDLDSSLAARKSLAQELNVHAGADGSAEQNIALQKAVMNKIAENGGKVPESLRN